MNVRYNKAVQAIAIAWFVILSTGQIVKAAEPAESWPQWHGPTRDCFVGGSAWPTSLGKDHLKLFLARRSGARLLRANCGGKSRLRGRNQGRED